MNSTAALNARPVGPRPLVVASGLTILAVSVLALLAALVDGQRGLNGVLVGGGAVLVVFLFGGAAVGMVANVLPGASMMIALLTYMLQLAVLALLFVAYQGSVEMQREVSRGWLAGGVIAATVAWTAAQLVVATRTRFETPDEAGDR